MDTWDHLGTNELLVEHRGSERLMVARVQNDCNGVLERVDFCWDFFPFCEIVCHCRPYLIKVSACSDSADIITDRLITWMANFDNDIEV